MINEQVAALFERIADLMEIDGADRFRINSYRRAARVIEDASENLNKLAEEGRLTGLPGVGKGTAERIQQYLDTGSIDVLDELEAKLPEGLPKLLEIQSMGPKKVAAVHQKLGITSVEDLKKAINSGELAKLSGFGATSVKKIAEGIEFLQRSGERTPLGIALPIAEQVMKHVKAMKSVGRVEVAGSIRRGRETTGDVDILCETDEGPAVTEAFTQLNGVKRVLAKGDTKGSITVDLGKNRELQIDLRAVPTESFGAALQYFTGSKEHNVRVREIAVKKKWRLSEYGLFDENDEQLAGKTEEEIYKKLKLPWIPPEQREDRGEFESGYSADDLVALDDIRGDLHMHTKASDGKNTIEEMALAAKKLSYSYIAICDHSKSSAIANGLSIDRMKKHIEEIRVVDENIKGIRVLVGTECDILPDGTVDYPDAILADCDCVVASVHSAMGSTSRARGKLNPTERTIAAMENPYVSIIGHPTGRLLGSRPPMDIDIDAVVEAAARTNTILECNASWQRLDLKDVHIRQALEAGVTLAINTDTHSTEGFRSMHYGVRTARRGGAKKDDVVNTLAPGKLIKRLIAKRA